MCSPAPQPGAAGDDRAARLRRAPPTWASPRAAIAETLRVATAGDYDTGLAKLNLSAAAGADPWSSCPTRHAHDLAAAGAPDRARRATARCTLGNVATHRRSTAGPAQIDRLDRARNVNFEVELAGVPLGEVDAQARGHCPA